MFYKESLQRMQKLASGKEFEECVRRINEEAQKIRSIGEEMWDTNQELGGSLVEIADAISVDAGTILQGVFEKTRW